MLKGNLRPLVKTVQDPTSKNTLIFYNSGGKGRKEKSGLTLFYLKRGSSFLKEEKPLFLPKAMKLLSIMIMDMNYDGQTDYFVRSLAKKGDKKFIQYSYFNQFGEPL